MEPEDLTKTLLWSRVEDVIELQTTDLTELLTTDLTDLLEDDEEIEVLVEMEDDLDPPTQNIDDFLVAEELSPDESQQRPRLRRSWIAMPPGNTNAQPDPERPTGLRPLRAPMPSLPRFPLLPPKPEAVSALPAFPLLPPEPRRIAPKAPPVRLPRFSLHDGQAAILSRRLLRSS